MATRPSAGNIKVRLVSDMEENRPVAATDTPFRIALLGDFSGRENRGVVETGRALSDRRVYQIDRDNFSVAMSQLNVEIRLPILGKDSPPVIFHPADLDDFHPDRLLENLAVFDALKEIRKASKNPTAFAAVANKFQGPAKLTEAAPPATSAGTTGDLLQQVLETTEDKSSTGRSRPPSDLDDFVRQIVQPYVVSKPDPMQAELVAKVDAAIGELMRMILHHPEFQALEAAWRGLFFLVSQLETDENLKLFLIDVSKAELAADLLALAEIDSTGFYELLVKRTAETRAEEPWAVFAGNYDFDQTREDAELLRRLAEVAKATGAPFIAAARPRLLGCDSLADTPDPDDWRATGDHVAREAWAALRKVPEASFLGLALPRFLLRLPFGKDTEPTEHFDFEEMENAPNHEHYLWGNPSFACAYLLAQAFSQYGWDFEPGVIQDISGLPVHVYKQKGESRAKPCAEAVLTQRAAEAILTQGLMPLLSFVHQDIVRLARFQSLADPLTPLLGRWR